MTALFDRAIERVRAMPSHEQDALARMMLRLTGEEQSAYVMTPEEEASLVTARLQIERGEFASPERIQAIWGRYVGFGSSAVLTSPFHHASHGPPSPKGKETKLDSFCETSMPASPPP